MTRKQKNTAIVKRIKTGKLERRFSLAKAGVFASARVAGHSIANALFGDSCSREARQKEILSEQAHYLATELGKLKGSIVKVGQMMALWGEHFLPKEVTEALHELEDNTAILDWSTVLPYLEEQLGATVLAKLAIDTTPIGAASLGQVHRATVLDTGEQICLKIQYPGVADAIDSDLDTIEQLLKISHIVPITAEFKSWLGEIRAMLKREVDYHLELATTQRFKAYLANDKRYIIPDVFAEFSSERVLATSYEPGIGIGSPECLELPIQRRNKIGEACLDLCWKEVFIWGEMQTDPNFGNYFIRLDDQGDDKLVLIDFGAIRQFPMHILKPGRALVKAAHSRNSEQIKKAMLYLGFVPKDTPTAVFEDFYPLCYLAIEPFVRPAPSSPDTALWQHEHAPYYNPKTGIYDWSFSNLAARALSLATKSAFSRYFTIPPKEFMFLSRKIIGAYTLMSVLRVQIEGESILAPYLDHVEPL